VPRGCAALPAADQRLAHAFGFILFERGRVSFLLGHANYIKNIEDRLALDL
jgi:hypothetical protein